MAPVALGLLEAVEAEGPAERLRRAGVTGKRPTALVPLYVSFAAFQGLDAVTTFRALDNGAQEKNALLGGMAHNRAALLAVKGGATVATVWLTEKLWKRNRVAAVALMAGVNGLYALVVAHNYRVGSRR